MVLLMVCGKLSFKYVLIGEFEVRSYNLSEMYLKLCVLRCVVLYCRVFGWLESSVLEFCIGEEEDNFFVKFLLNIYFVVFCWFCKGMCVVEICVCIE